VHAIHHDGPHYRVDGIHLAEPSPQRTPLLYQAGASKRGRAFAAKHAEAIFLNGQTKPMLAKAVHAIRTATRDFGRDPHDIRLFAGLNVITAPMRIGDLASLSAVGARAPFVVGSPQDVADELADWAEQTDIDGFNLVRLVAPESLAAFVDLVVPELQSRGLYKTRYDEGTLREKLFPDRGALLHHTHPGARFRHGQT
jgi:alkanesulfonate monooxygenase SsuD/methylene tetrahydromethanopterin reductase-like flavin-dependent oxidoreductase (luciferase family)